jgi:hypothetical protein
MSDDNNTHQMNKGKDAFDDPWRDENESSEK